MTDQQYHDQQPSVCVCVYIDTYTCVCKFVHIWLNEPFNVFKVAIINSRADKEVFLLGNVIRILLSYVLQACVPSTNNVEKAIYIYISQSAEVEVAVGSYRT